MLKPPGATRSRPVSQPSSRRPVQESPDDVIRQLQRLPSNKRCCDCNSRLPACVNLTVGSFICMTCAGIHREQSQRVKGVGHSSFTAEEAEKMKTSDNDSVNAVYMARYDPNRERMKAPQDNLDPAYLKAWIRRKYEDAAWFRLESDVAMQSVGGERMSDTYSRPTVVNIPSVLPPQEKDLLGDSNNFLALPSQDWNAFGGATTIQQPTFEANFANFSISSSTETCKQQFASPQQQQQNPHLDQVGSSRQGLPNGGGNIAQLPPQQNHIRANVHSGVDGVNASHSQHRFDAFNPLNEAGSVLNPRRFELKVESSSEGFASRNILYSGSHQESGAPMCAGSEKVSRIAPAWTADFPIRDVQAGVLQSSAFPVSTSKVSTGMLETINDKKSQFTPGQIVLYKRDSFAGEAKVLKVHFDDHLEPSYTIVVNGEEKQTDSSHLAAEKTMRAEMDELIANLTICQLHELRSFVFQLKARGGFVERESKDLQPLSGRAVPSATCGGEESSADCEVGAKSIQAMEVEPRHNSAFAGAASHQVALGSRGEATSMTPVFGNLPIRQHPTGSQEIIMEGSVGAQDQKRSIAAALPLPPSTVADHGFPLSPTSPKGNPFDFY